MREHRATHRQGYETGTIDKGALRPQVPDVRTRLEGLTGLYAEAAHVRPLGSPHNGPDTPDNILCLCPNHHVLFDHGGAGISGDLTLIGAEGRLTVDPKHTLNESHLSYRREHYQIKG